jgi:hypothetical protein
VEDGNPAKAWIVGLKYSLGLRLKKQDSGIDPYLLEGGKIELLPSAFSRPFENYDEDRMQGSNVFESVGFRFVVKPDEAGRDKDLWEVFHRCCKAKNHVGKR